MPEPRRLSNREVAAFLKDQPADFQTKVWVPGSSLLNHEGIPPEVKASGVVLIGGELALGTLE